MKQHNHKVLLIGRGPSALLKPDFSSYDLVIRLKQCWCKNEIKNRCDILVFNADEWITHPDGEYDIFQDCYKHIDEVWYFDMFDLGSIQTKNEHMKAILNQIKCHKICNYNINIIGKKYGFNLTKPPRFTTGMAAIIEVLRIYSDSYIDLIGFDNIVQNTNLGEFDHSERKVGWTPNGYVEIHNINMEHMLLKDLVKKHEKLNVLQY